MSVARPFLIQTPNFCLEPKCIYFICICWTKKKLLKGNIYVHNHIYQTYVCACIVVFCFFFTEVHVYICIYSLRECMRVFVYKRIQEMNVYLPVLEFVLATGLCVSTHIHVCVHIYPPTYTLIFHRVLIKPNVCNVVVLTHWCIMFISK